MDHKSFSKCNFNDVFFVTNQDLESLMRPGVDLDQVLPNRTLYPNIHEELRIFIERRIQMHHCVREQNAHFVEASIDALVMGILEEIVFWFLNIRPNFCLREQSQMNFEHGNTCEYQN
jgi:hypothetical protein